MLSISRLAITTVTVLFGLYHALLGFLFLDEYQEPNFAIAGLVCYVAVLLYALLDRPGLMMRPSSAALVLLVTVVLPQLVFLALGEIRQGSYTTWHIAGIGTLLAIVAVRKFELVAWIGLVLVFAQVLVWGGPAVFFNSGLVGAFLLVATAQTASWAMKSSSNSAAEFRKRALQIDTATAASSAARKERNKRLNETLRTALPLLEKISQANGELSKEDRALASITEAELRDQIRGRNLLSNEVITETRKARQRGVEVQLLDDGGLDGLTHEERATYHWEIARRLREVSAGKVVIRAATGNTWRVSMAAIRKDSDSPDLFVRI